MESNSYRARRVQRLKKIIVGTVAALIIIPTLLCIFLTFRICSLENEIDIMLESYANRNPVENSTSNVVENEGNGNQSGDEGNTDDNEADKETSTDEPTSDVVAKPEPLPDGKYVYLTFDDGPSARTDEILQILDRYGVKATFFVNGHTGETMESRYIAIVDNGHALGIHTYTHNYKTVYGGLESFANEVTSLHDYLYEVTGVDVRLFRFPGGTSNTIVDDIYPYIQWINDNGYSYHDWNCSSGDANKVKPTADQIIANCTKQIKAGYKNLVILMHDLGTKDTTVQALPRLIELLLENGYEIRAIDERSKPVHHREIE